MSDDLIPQHIIDLANESVDFDSENVPSEIIRAIKNTMYFHNLYMNHKIILNHKKIELDFLYGNLHDELNNGSLLCNTKELHTLIIGEKEYVEQRKHINGLEVIVSFLEGTLDNLISLPHIARHIVNDKKLIMDV
jgi:hypothetical protein